MAAVEVEIAGLLGQPVVPDPDWLTAYAEALNNEATRAQYRADLAHEYKAALEGVDLTTRAVSQARQQLDPSLAAEASTARYASRARRLLQPSLLGPACVTRAQILAARWQDRLTAACATALAAQQYADHAEELLAQAQRRVADAVEAVDAEDWQEVCPD